MQNLIVITGQTATGKTNLAIEYARKYNGELINADSRQIYKYLDIITGKDIPTLKRSRIKTHLFDIVDPKKSFSSFEYVKCAIAVIKDLWKRGKTPVLVGGTYFYIKHLLYGFDVHVAPNRMLRTELEKKSVEELQSKLLSIDKSVFLSMNSSDRNNPRRLIRKIEILKSGSTSEVGVSLSHLGGESGKIKIIGLRHKNREALVEAITKRVHKRFEQGAVKEVRNLLLMGYKKTDHGLQTIGYIQIIQYFNKTITQKEAIKQWIAKEVQYAKRQHTFMKRDPNITWIDV